MWKIETTMKNWRCRLVRWLQKRKTTFFE